MHVLTVDLHVAAAHSDIIVDNDVYIKYKALFDTFFAASRFGVLKAEYLG